MIALRAAALGAAAVLGGCAARSALPAPPPVATRAAAGERLRSWENAIGPRYQWDHNHGYCGEVSFASAGLYYGEYVSQYDVRLAASRAPQYRYRSQLLLGVNALRAARRMHLDATPWRGAAGASTDDFLVWVKRNVLLGRPVAIGIYTNEYRFYGDRNPLAGSPQYDHIVPVIGVQSRRPLGSGGYFPGDVLTFSDNGLWGRNRRAARYLFSYAFGRFERTRRQANARNGPIYSIADDRRNFGIAVNGVADGDREALPVSVQTDLNYELPQIRQGSNQRPPPEPLVLTVTLSGLTPGRSYELYRYDALAAIPDRAFNASASRAAQRWTIRARARTYAFSQRIESDEVAAYRAVAAGAP